MSNAATEPCRSGDIPEDTTECGEFWDEAEAAAERQRLSSLTADERVRFVVVEVDVTVVYPDDEAPP